MEKELLNSDKELLLKDFCARLPYGTICATADNDGSLPNIWKIVKADMINEDFFLIHDSLEAYRTVDVKEIRPYLFPLSSMTEEQRKEFILYSGYSVRVEGCGKLAEEYHYELVVYGNQLRPNYNDIDWLNAHHFDYRGLIEKDLAIDATGKNIY